MTHDDANRSLQAYVEPGAPTARRHPCIVHRRSALPLPPLGRPPSKVATRSWPTGARTATTPTPGRRPTRPGGQGRPLVAASTSRYDDATANGRTTTCSSSPSRPTAGAASSPRCTVSSGDPFGARSAALCLLAVAALAASPAAAGPPRPPARPPTAPLTPDRSSPRPPIPCSSVPATSPSADSSAMRRPRPSSPRSRAACSRRATSPTRRDAPRTSATATDRARAASGRAPRRRPATTNTSRRRETLLRVLRQARRAGGRGLVRI